MKKILLLALLISFTACKEETKTENQKNDNNTIVEREYPESISKIFKAHGGIDTWNSLNGMYFEIENPGGNDTYQVSLKDRKSLITMKHHKLGYDGKDVWLQKLDTISYRGNAKFYYNLMFYFYAMPFVLGDEGIHYNEVEPIAYEGVSYPGILISYDEGVGESSDDEYIVYYHPETHKMEWLGYTVTYFSKEKSKKFNLIKYDTWETVSGVSLPKSIQWHQYADGVIGDMRNEVRFANATLSKDQMKEALFKVPDSTMIVK